MRFYTFTIFNFRLLRCRFTCLSYHSSFSDLLGKHHLTLWTSSAAHSQFNVLKTIKKIRKKIFNQDELKMECAVGNREMGFWQCKKAEMVLISFLTSGFAVFICLWLLVLPNSNNLINHVLFSRPQGTCTLRMYIHIIFSCSLALLVTQVPLENLLYSRLFERFEEFEPHRQNIRVYVHCI